jgi:hypothetical protein
LPRPPARRSGPKSSIDNGAITMPKLFLSTNTSVSAEPTQNLSVEVSTETSADVELAPTSEPPSVNPQPITDEEPAVLDEAERERCVLESRKQDEAREWEAEFYEDDLDYPYD